MVGSVILANRFPHGKRFSLEGNEALLPLLDAVLEAGAALGVDQVLMGMPHRGRVNVLANLLGHPVDALIDYFEPAPAHPERQRDLVYHLGGTSRVQRPRTAPCACDWQATCCRTSLSVYIRSSSAWRARRAPRRVTD